MPVIMVDNVDELSHISKVYILLLLQCGGLAVLF